MPYFAPNRHTARQMRRPLVEDAGKPGGRTAPPSTAMAAPSPRCRRKPGQGRGRFGKTPRTSLARPTQDVADGPEVQPAQRLQPMLSILQSREATCGNQPGWPLALQRSTELAQSAEELSHGLPLEHHIKHIVSEHPIQILVGTVAQPCVALRALLDPRGPVDPIAFIELECITKPVGADFNQTSHQYHRILDCHRCALRHMRLHGMAGVSQQDDTSAAPQGQRVPRHQRPFRHLLGRSDQPLYVGMITFERRRSSSVVLGSQAALGSLLVPERR